MQSLKTEIHKGKPKPSVKPRSRTKSLTKKVQILIQRRQHRENTMCARTIKFTKIQSNKCIKSLTPLYSSHPPTATSKPPRKTKEEVITLTVESKCTTNDVADL